MLSKWEKQDSIIGITCHEQSATRDHTWRDSLLFWVNLIMSNKKSYSVSEIEMNSNSHPAPCSHKEQEELQNVKTWTNWQSSCFSNIDGTFEAISSILFDFQTTELISQSLEPSQNLAKDPRGTPEHGTSSISRQRPRNFDLSFRIGEAVVDINPTCAVEAEFAIQIETETVLGLKISEEYNCTTGHISFLKAL